MKTIALIPARSGSKRVPGKNIRELKGKPLMVWSIEVALACEGIDEVIVTTDSVNYCEIAKKHGAVDFLRPGDLANDNATDLDVIDHALASVKPDLIAYLRPTTPFRNVHRLNMAINIMQNNPNIPSLRSVHEMSESAYKFFRIKNGRLCPLSKKDLTDAPNQDCPKTFRPNGYIDIVRRENVESGSLWGSGRYPFITPWTLEIDKEEDWKYAEYLAQRELNAPFVFRTGKRKISSQ